MGATSEMFIKQELPSQEEELRITAVLKSVSYITVEVKKTLQRVYLSFDVNLGFINVIIGNSSIRDY